MLRKKSRKRVRKPFSRRWFRPCLEQLEDRRVLAIVTVTSTLDTVTEDGVVTLREAILSTNSNTNINADVFAFGAYGTDTIEFNIPFNDPNHVYYIDDNTIAPQVPNGTVTMFTSGGALALGTTTEAIDAAIGGIDPDWAHSWYAIRLTSALPDITGAVTIDGYTQFGAVENTAAISNASTAILRVELMAAAGNEFDGLRVTSGGSTIRGLAIHGFGFFGPLTENGVELASSGNTVAGNHLGADVSGLAGSGNEGAGVFIDNAANNTIGGSDPADRNLVAGNRNGVLVFGTLATGNTVLGNELVRHPNGAGVVIANGASQNTVGGATAAAANVIGLNSAGVRITGVDPFTGQSTGNSSNGNVVAGNFIGTNANGANLPNNDNVSLNFGAVNNRIGGITPTPGVAPGNVIANGLYGIFIADSSVSGTQIQGNLIGLNAGGTTAAGNFYTGVQDAGTNTFIGAEDFDARNVISAQKRRAGIVLQGFGAVVEHNYIGADITGTLDRGNFGGGILVQSSANTIFENTIAFNHGFDDGEEVSPGDGILVSDAAGNVILGNSIFANDGLGIELANNTGADGVPLPNDTDDPDPGSNNLQNYPVLTSAVNSGSITVIQGTFNSLPSRNFKLEFFANAPGSLDPSGFGEGESPIGTLVVTTNASGDVQGGFNFSPSGQVPVGYFITATATLLQNAALAEAEGQGDDNEVETSEFSAGIAVTGAAVSTADLELTKIASNSSLPFGAQVTFTVTLTNKGPNNAANITVADAIPAALTNVTVTPAANTSFAAGVWTIPNLSATSGSNTVQLTITGTLPNTAQQISNTAQVTASSLTDPDSTPNNNVPSEDDQATATVTVFDPGADLELTKIASSSALPFGSQVTFTVTLTNKGPRAAANITVADAIPAALTNVTVTPAANTSFAAGVWTVPNLSATSGSNSAQLTITGTLPSTSTTVTNTAQVTASSITDPDSTPNNNVPSEDDQASATVTVFDPAAVGSISGFVYVDVNNNGVKDAQELGLPNVTVTLTGAISTSVVTAANGSYTFANLPVGTYTVTETQPSAFNDGTDTRGTPQLGTVQNDQFVNISLPASGTLVNYNFGERGLKANLVGKRLFLASTGPQSAGAVQSPSGQQAFSFLASASGTFNVSGDGEGEGVGFELYTADWLPVAMGALNQLSAQVTSGQQYVLVVNSTSATEIDWSLLGDTLAEAFGYFTNHANRCDVNHNGAVTNLDAFELIARLRASGECVLESPADRAAAVDLYLDVTGDNCFTNLDIFRLISELRKHGTPSGEGVSAPDTISAPLTLPLSETLPLGNGTVAAADIVRDACESPSHSSAYGFLPSAGTTFSNSRQEATNDTLGHADDTWQETNWLTASDEELLADLLS